jgi:hypothetical protein
LGASPKFGGVGFAEGDGPGLFETFHDERVSGGDKIAIDGGAEGGADSGSGLEILMGNGQTVQRPE